MYIECVKALPAAAQKLAYPNARNRISSTIAHSSMKPTLFIFLQYAIACNFLKDEKKMNK